MPTPPYAKVLVAVNGGAPTSGGIDVPSAASIALTMESNVAVQQQRWEIFDYPEGFTAPAGWSTDANGTIFSTAETPPTFTLPTSATRWGSYALRLKINQQINDNVNVIPNLTDETTRLDMLSPKGQRDIGALEGGQFCTSTTLIKQWIRSYQRNLRALEGLLPNPFDPSSLSLSGWWRGSYAGAPWTPSGSAGGSGANGNLVVGTAPSTGTAVNGFTPATFNGTTQYLVNSHALTTFFTTAAASLVVLFNASAAAAGAADGSPHLDPGLFVDVGGGVDFTCGFSTKGFRIGWNDGGWKDLYVPAAINGWHLGQFKYDGTNLKVRVDSSAWSSLAAGSGFGFTSTIGVGEKYDNSGFFNGSILEIITAQAALSDGNFDNIKAYVNARYGLSL